MAGRCSQCDTRLTWDVAKKSLHGCIACPTCGASLRVWGWGGWVAAGGAFLVFQIGWPLLGSAIGFGWSTAICIPLILALLGGFSFAWRATVRARLIEWGRGRCPRCGGQAECPDGKPCAACQHRWRDPRDPRAAKVRHGIIPCPQCGTPRTCRSEKGPGISTWDCHGCGARVQIRQTSIVITILAVISIYGGIALLSDWAGWPKSEMRVVSAVLFVVLIVASGWIGPYLGARVVRWGEGTVGDAAITSPICRFPGAPSAAQARDTSQMPLPRITDPLGKRR